MVTAIIIISLSIDSLCNEPFPDPRPVSQYNPRVIDSCVRNHLVINWNELRPQESLGLYATKDFESECRILEVGRFHLNNRNFCGIMGNSENRQSRERPDGLRAAVYVERHIHEFVCSHTYRGQHLDDDRNANHMFIVLTVAKSSVLFLNSALDDSGTVANVEFVTNNRKSYIRALKDIACYKQLYGDYLLQATQEELDD